MNRPGNKLEPPSLIGAETDESVASYGNSQRKVTPAHVAGTISTYVRALVITVFWAVVGAAALAAGWVALRIIWWAGGEVLKALGV